MAKDTPKVFSFSTRLETFHRSFTHTAIIIPAEILEQLPSKGRIRTKGTFNKTPFALAIQHRKDGARFFMVSAQLRREAKIQSGDPGKVEFWQGGFRPSGRARRTASSSNKIRIVTQRNCGKHLHQVYKEAFPIM